MKIRINSQDLGQIGSIDTYNMFSGGSVDDYYIESYNDEHGTDYTYDNFDWSYDHKQIVKDLAETSRDWIVENVVGDIVKDVGEILGTYSPREYNFRTDSWEAEWEIDDTELAKYIDQHKEAYNAWYSGSSWESTINAKDDDNPAKYECQVLAMLEFYLSREFSVDDYNDTMWEAEFDIYCENTTMECLEERSSDEN